jgi:multicomponent Na+:H+ antiporter subunit D
MGGLGLIGVPLTCGFVSKWLLLTAAVESEYWWVAALMLLSSLLALVYVWRVVETLYFSEPSEKALAAKEAPPLMLLTTYVVIGASIAFGIWTEFSAGVAAETAEYLLAGPVEVLTGGKP